MQFIKCSLAVMTIVVFLYPVQVMPLGTCTYCSELFGASAQKVVCKQPKNRFMVTEINVGQAVQEHIVPIFLTAVACTGLVVLGKLIYDYINPSDEYYTDWAETIIKDLQKVEARLIKLKSCADENVAVDILLALAQSNGGGKASIELLDKQLKDYEAAIKKITVALEKRINKPGDRDSVSIGIMENYKNRLASWVPVLVNARNKISQYGCFVALFQLSDSLTKCYKKELSLISLVKSSKDRTGKKAVVDTIQQLVTSCYDDHAHKLVTDILKIEKALAQCMEKSIKPEWIENAHDLVAKLKKLAIALMVCQKYLNAVDASLSVARLQGFIGGYLSAPRTTIMYRYAALPTDDFYTDDSYYTYTTHGYY